jgi:hypothetical protein
MAKAEVLALRVIADQLENGESQPISISVSLPLSAGRTYTRMNREGSKAGPLFTSGRFAWLLSSVRCMHRAEALTESSPNAVKG